MPVYSSVYVFTAPLTDHIAVSLVRDPTNLPAFYRWKLAFEMPLRAASFESLKLDSPKVMRELLRKGRYVSKPSAEILPFGRS